MHAVREQVELGELASDLADEFTALAHAEGRTLEVTGDEALALADPEHVLRIGRILLENAFAHTLPGTPVTVRVRAPAALEVEDEGPGIAEEEQEQIFERFTRLGGMRASGSGLGLTIARELATLMDGSITVESRPGRTVFRLSLPVSSMSPAREAVPA